MKPRHTAALALVGWYLIVPPPSYDWEHAKHPTDEVRLDAHLSQWGSFGSFNSLKDCENENSKNFSEGKSAVSRLKFPRDDNPDHFYAEIMEANLFGKCIATDDPRLKEK